MKVGRRVYPREDGNLYLAEGDYGFNETQRYWVVRPFGQHAGSIRKHTVVEHEDGTITVSPSILFRETDANGVWHDVWHGYLERGVWREA